MKRILLVSPALLLSACGSIGNLLQEPPPTLADIEAVPIPQQDEALPRVNRQELVAIYQDVLDQQSNPDTRLKVQHRLADIELQLAEEQQVNGEESSAAFDSAIHTYESLLAENPDYEGQDQVLYQLSKAHDLAGNSEQSQATLDRLIAASPQSAHIPETQFRRAERQFVEGAYAAAEQTYAEVIRFGAQTPYHTRALYMQGWSRFKQDHYRQSIAAFTASLDDLLKEDSAIEGLSRGDRELVQDSLRVLALVFSYLEGTETIASAYSELGVRHYQHLLYQSLGELYLSQERYRDSAETYRAYTLAHPDSNRAHQFKLLEIDAFEAGGFADLVLTAKEEYVETFAVQGDYWAHSDQASQQDIADQLQDFIEELGNHYHAQAQAQAPQPETGRPAAAEADYARAAQYYRLYLESFPEDEGASRIAFLLAESLFEARDFTGAIDAYEQVAYVYADEARAPDAAYTAILAYNELASQAPEQQTELLRRKRINSELRFYEHFDTDSRAPEVLAHAATELHKLQEYDSALTAAVVLLQRSPPASKTLQVPMWLVSAHSLFATEQFEAAEAAYRESLALMDEGDPRRAESTDNLAASIYRQGEAAATAGAYADAAEHFGRVVATTPQSDIRTNAQYDGAMALQNAGQLAAANDLLIDFRSRYPKHELSAGITPLLVQNYEALELWREAAVELDGMAAASSDPESSRQAVLVAAQYYEQVGDTDTAIARYRQYANQWRQPLPEFLEVTQHLAELYAQRGQNDKQRYWLQQIISAHDSAGAAQSERSLYLAASSAATLADYRYSRFAAIELKQPLKNSLPEKRRAMQEALAAYGRSSDYGVEEFTTKSTFYIGRLYHSLSRDLYESERPSGLDALALEQYEIMLEEQAYPFEEKAIAVHESNVLRCHEGVYDDWVKQSFAALAELLPARYGKQELGDVESEEDIEAAGGKRRWRKLNTLNRDALAMRQRGEFAAAEEVYLSALSVQEAYPATHHNLGILYDLYLGQPQKALQHYARYQNLSGGDRRVSGWIADLQRQYPDYAEVM